MNVAVVGLGAVGARVARQLHTLGIPLRHLVDVADGRATAVAASLGAGRPASWDAAIGSNPDLVVLAQPGNHQKHAMRALEAGAHVVSVSDRADSARALLDLDAEATERGTTVAVGAGFSPGLSCILARHAAEGFSEVDEIHIARAGRGGPACSRDRWLALAERGTRWHDGAWRRSPSPSPELVWFPDPVGARECYGGALPEPFLLQRAFLGARRVSARIAASRWERLSARVPRPRRATSEGGAGAIHVEVRGRRGGATDTAVLGAVDRPALAAGTVAAVAAKLILDGVVDRRGAGGLASLVDDSAGFLRLLGELGVKAAVFEGAG